MTETILELTETSVKEMGRMCTEVQNRLARDLGPVEQRISELKSQFDDFLELLRHVDKRVRDVEEKVDLVQFYTPLNTALPRGVLCEGVTSMTAMRPLFPDLHS